MTRKSRREIERAVENLDGDDENRLEIVADGFGWWGEEPAPTEFLVELGFVVEREERAQKNGYEDVLLHTTPDAGDVTNQIQWHCPGPTAPKDAIRIRWDQDTLDEVLAAAEYPVEHKPPTLPDEPVTVVEGDGWDAVAERDLVAENMVDRPARAERNGWDVIGPAPPVANREKYDLVEIDAEPVRYSDRRSQRRSRT